MYTGILDMRVEKSDIKDIHPKKNMYLDLDPENL